ncbi:MAG: hypothetical protein IKJ27_04160 [Clostridia bacterium]|nr:hypothetical protein [Clostridia bacterium]
MMSKKMIKVICIIMAVLMALGTCAALVSVFAVDEAYYETYVNPKTGDNDGDYLVPAGIAVAAILAIIVCVALPKMRSKDSDDDDDEDEADDVEEAENIKSSPEKTANVNKNSGKPEIIKKDK